MLNRRFAIWILTVFVLGALSLPLGAQSLKPEHLRALSFRFAGPMQGNRASAVAGIPGNPNVYYIGAASGGIWKSVDGGFRWQPVFDQEPAQSIGALAVDPAQPSVIWAGTGESWVIRNGITPGDGIYKSADAGKTWMNMGLSDAGLISRVIVNPYNSNNVFVCATGVGTHPQHSRGVWRTSDGGKTWQQVLFVNEDTGCSGLAMDAHNPEVLFAGMWQWKVRPWAMTSGGPSSGVYVSRDGGNTWQEIQGQGLPHPPVGKIDVAIAPSDANRVYALIQTANQGSLWRSDDGGKNWRVVNYSRLLTERAGYFVRLAISPSNEDKVYVACNSFYVSTDGGETFHDVHWGGDNHDIWIDPKNPDRMMISDDEGAEMSQTGGRNWRHVSLPIGQTYHVAVDNQIPYWVYTNMQDDSSERGPAYPFSTPGPDSVEEQFGGRWQEDLGGCESGFTYPDPTDPRIIWSTCYGDEITRLDTRIGYARAVSPWPDHPLDSPPEDVKYRCHWTPPMAIDPFDHNTVYYGCQVIFKTTDGGQSWQVISPDLSTQNPKYLAPSGGIMQDNLGQFYGEVVFAIAPSPMERGLIWAGTNDGQVWLTRNGGRRWANVTKNISGLPPWGTVSRIEPSNFDAATAYVAVDRSLMGDTRPYIYKTTDFGGHWKLAVNGIPAGVFSNVSSVAQDPYNKNLLFAGTGNGIYFSIDDGANWMLLDSGLPHAPVSWETVQKNFHDLVVATYGRGIYVLEDITPLEQMTATTMSEPAHIFRSRPSYRFFRGAHALIDFSLAAAPKDKVKIDILDSQGSLIRHLEAPGQPGMNRVVWDMRYAPPQLIQLRTTPASNPHVWDDLRFLGKQWRPITHWGIREAEVGPMAAPGTYTVKLTTGGKSY
ncbi:MAG TPA: sialidase, partial [Terriglobia bacterium]|nr:sialidase [Terriglobia bacterium]